MVVRLILNINIQAAITQNGGANSDDHGNGSFYGGGSDYGRAQCEVCLGP